MDNDPLSGCEGSLLVINKYSDTGRESGFKKHHDLPATRKGYTLPLKLIINPFDSFKVNLDD